MLFTYASVRDEDAVLDSDVDAVGLGVDWAGDYAHGGEEEKGD